MIRYISTLLLALTLSLPAYALNLNQAMSALGDAKASGQLGVDMLVALAVGCKQAGGEHGELARNEVGPFAVVAHDLDTVGDV